MIRRKAGVFLAGCVFISAFISTCYAFGGEQESSLAAAARAAKSQFVPLTADDLKEAKTELTAAAERLDQRLKEDAKNGEGWRKFTKLDTLLEELRQAKGPNVGVLNSIYAKFSTGQEGLELVWFVDVRQALHKYIERAGAIDNPQAKVLYEKLLDQLATDLEAAGTHPNADQAFRIGEILRWLPLVRQAPELVQSVRSRLVHPNVYLQANGELAAAGIAGPVDETAPVCDCILGTDINGVGHTVGQTTVCLFPDVEEATLDVILRAVNYSQTTGRNGPVCIYTTGQTEIGACKRLWIDADGLWSHPAAANAATHTTINDISAVKGGQLVEHIAWKRAGQQQGEAEAIASEHARSLAAQRVDQQADEMLQKANQDYQNKFRSPLGERSAFPQTLRFSTTTDTFSVLALEAAADQLAAATAPPELTEKNPDMAVRIHQSAHQQRGGDGALRHGPARGNVANHGGRSVGLRARAAQTGRGPRAVDDRIRPAAADLGELRRGRFQRDLAGAAFLQERPTLSGNERHGRLQTGEGRRRFQGGPPGRTADPPARFRPQPAPA